ncbi:MAG TPA: CynX/NimT family MFS transporter, partial [Moraxellaceae bacterium]
MPDSPTPKLADELLLDREPPGTPPTPGSGLLLLAVLVLVAINLRPALSSLAPVLKAVQDGLGLSGSSIGLLTTLPVLCFGLAGPLAPALARRFGSEKVLGAMLLVLAAGILLRAAGVAGLFAGTLLAGASIGVVNVLLPGLLKRDFADRADRVTGLYTMALSLGAALAAGLTVPVAQWSGSWRIALAFWALPALLAALAWRPWQRVPHTPQPLPARSASLLRDPLAWQVTLYMGLQSSLAYCVFGWLPAILQDRGLTALEAGFSLSVSVLIQLITALGAPLLASAHVRRGGDQRATIALMLALTLSGLLGCLFAPATTLWLWIVLLGLGQGGTFSMALALIVLRSRDAATAARLSGMVQGVGYSLAALGPFAVGLLHEFTGGWNALGWLFTAISVAALVCGLQAGRQRFVLAP